MSGSLAGDDVNAGSSHHSPQMSKKAGSMEVAIPKAVQSLSRPAFGRGANHKRWTRIFEKRSHLYLLKQPRGRGKMTTSK